MILSWFRKRNHTPGPGAEQRLRARYQHFRRLLILNNECLELMAGLQEDLQYVDPLAGVIGERCRSLFGKLTETVNALGGLTGLSQDVLLRALAAQSEEVERFTGLLSRGTPARLSARLDELDAEAVGEAGGKAAMLAEVGNRLRLPVPEGFVITTEAYRRCCALPLWRQVRDLTRDLDPEDAQALGEVSRKLCGAIDGLPLPPELEEEILARTREMPRAGGFAVRSSAVGEGARHTFAGQYTTLLNVPPGDGPAAYRQVLAGRFSERALSYRLSMGIPEVESPLAVLFMPMVEAQSAGILYTRNPSSRRSSEIWVTATRGLGLEIASGGAPADLFILSRKRGHPVLESLLASKPVRVAPSAGGGLERVHIGEAEAAGPSLTVEQLRLLAEWGMAIEKHFGAPQDIEWALDIRGQMWIVQTRPLAVTNSGGRSGARPKSEAVLSGGRTIYSGRVSGNAWLVDDGHPLKDAPAHSIVFMERASPEIARILSKAEGIAAEWGNLAGHAATLLREARVPSVFLLKGAFEELRNGEAVSLDAANAKVYRGSHWPPRERQSAEETASSRPRTDPVNQRVLQLNLLDPTGAGFRDKSCKSAHDVLRYCHEKAVEAMFACDDRETNLGVSHCRQLVTTLPLNISILDLGGGIDPAAGGFRIQPEQVVSRPFRALWKGFVHPDVRWTREMPIGFSDLASVLAGSLSSSSYMSRALGEKSFLLVAGDYLNLNARLAYHFTLIDASLSGAAPNNHVSFRFAGGGATRGRRSLRACFIEACLRHYGFQVDRRSDLVNAWIRGLPLEVMEDKLDILGRLTASTCQLDMYMTNSGLMQWYVRQFLAGNYAFELPPEEPGTES